VGRKNRWVLDEADVTLQPRYQSAPNCELRLALEGWNDWSIVDLVPKTPDQENEDVFEVLDARLQSCALGVANLVKVGNYGAYVTEDPGERGFYHVKWTSLPCSLQEDLQCTNFCPPMTIEAGELVCKALWLNKVPRTLDWYTAGDKNGCPAEDGCRPICHVNFLRQGEKKVSERKSPKK